MTLDIVRFATCDYQECERPSARGHRCRQCDRNLCFYHLYQPFHTCGSLSPNNQLLEELDVVDEVYNIVTTMNMIALEDLASTLNNGIACTFVPGEFFGASSIMGNANWHGWLRFRNGTSWIVRVPRTEKDGVPNYLTEYMVKSEYATLKFLEGTNVPAPKAYCYGLASDPLNTVRVSFICMEVLQGTPYSSSAASPEMQDRVSDQLANILIEISRYPLPRAGSLVPRSDRETFVSSFASNRFLTMHRYGPVNSAIEYFESTADQFLDLIADGQLYHEFPTVAFEFWTVLKEHASLLAQYEEPGCFFLKHIDDKGDHLLVDTEGNITGIIDWQFARCVPASEAFGPSLMTANLSALYSGNWAATAEDIQLAQKLRQKGASDLSDHMQRNGFARAFSQGLARGLVVEEASLLLYQIIDGLRTRQLWKGDEIFANLERDPRYLRATAVQGEPIFDDLD